MDCKLERISNCIYSQTCFEALQRSGDFQEIGNLDEPQSGTQNPSINRDRLLLKMTLIQRTFHKLSAADHHCVYLREICETLVVRFNLLTCLISLLGSDDQLIAFSASKCLVKVVGGLALSAEMRSRFREELLSFDLHGLQAEGHSSWRLTYTMEFLRKIVKFCHDDWNAGPAHTGLEEQTCECGFDKRKFSVSKAALVNLTLAWDRWTDILPLCIPLLNNPWGFSLQDVSTCPMPTILIRCSTMSSTLHQNNLALIEMKENAMISFFMFLCEVVKYTQLNENQRSEIAAVRSRKDMHGKTAMPSQRSVAENGSLDRSHKVVCESQLWPMPDEVQMLLKVIPDLVLLLHLPSLSAMCFKSVLSVLWEVYPPSESITPHRKWTRSHLPILLSSASLISGVHCCLLKNIPQITWTGFGGQHCGLLRNEKPSKPDSICLRKLSILLLKASLVILEHGASEDRETVLDTIMLWSRSLDDDVSESSMPCDLVIELFSDQDDELVEVLLNLLKIYQNIQSYQDEAQAGNTILQLINPHYLFHSMLDSICFDHSVLLDFLISPETSFLCYLSVYLHFLLGNWQNFCSGSIRDCEKALHPKLERDSCKLQEETHGLPDLSCSGISSSKTGDTGYPKHCCESTSNGNSFCALQYISMAYSSGESSEEDQKTDMCSTDLAVSSKESLAKSTASVVEVGPHPHCCNHELNLNSDTDCIGHVSTCTEQTTLENGNATDDSETEQVTKSKNPEMMDRVMAVLIRLRMSIERLHQGNLFPYNAEPLLRTLISIEKLYDDCS